jgi:hypothetical protein
MAYLLAILPLLLLVSLFGCILRMLDALLLSFAKAGEPLLAGVVVEIDLLDFGGHLPLFRHGTHDGKKIRESLQKKSRKTHSAWCL